jgi:hypothetical protein
VDTSIAYVGGNAVHADNDEPSTARKAAPRDAVIDTLTASDSGATFTKITLLPFDGLTLEEINGLNNNIT